MKFPKLTYWWTWNLKFKVPRTPNPNHTWFANCVAGSYGFVGGANGCVCGSYSWWILQFSSWILRFIGGSYSCVVWSYSCVGGSYHFVGESNMWFCIFFLQIWKLFDSLVLKFLWLILSFFRCLLVAIITSQGVSVNYSTHKRVESGVETNLWLR